MNPIPDLDCYCFNPDCRTTLSRGALSPHNSSRTLFCRTCGDRLLLSDRYFAIRLLGQGKLSRTLLALDQAQSPPTLCVVKQFQEATRFDLSHSLLERSRLECDRAYPTQLPNCLQQFAQDGQFYSVQEYISGDNLAVILAQKGSLNATEIWQILAAVVPAIQWLHAAGVMHGDIKPENVICRGGQLEDLVLVDPIAASFAPAAIGNPGYAAPEQLAGNPVVASDLYSLGVTCIHLLTGVHPFHLHDPVDRRWDWRTYWLPNDAAARRQDEPLAELLDRLIAPDLTRRMNSATDVLTVIGKRWGQPKRMVSLRSSAWICKTTLTGHEGLFAQVNAIALAPDAQLLASASDDKTIRLWDLQTQATCFVLQGHTHFVKSVAFQPHDRALLASGGHDRTIKFWNLDTRSEIQTLNGHQQAVNAVCFSADGMLLASGSSDKTVKLWSQTGELVASLQGHRLGVNALAFSRVSGSNCFASASADATVKLWDVGTLALLQTLQGHTAAVRSLAFSADGQWLATAGDDRTIRLWETRSWQCQRILSGHPWVVTALAFSPDGAMLISGSWDKTVKVWQVTTGKEIDALVGHTDSVSCVAIAQNILVSGSHDRTMKLWCDRNLQ